MLTRALADEYARRLDRQERRIDELRRDLEDVARELKRRPDKAEEAELVELIAFRPAPSTSTCNRQ